MNYIDWRRVSLNIDCKIREAMELLDKEAIQIILVIDNADKLKGTITDGDIRRHLLAGGGLDDPVSQAMNDSPIVGSAHSNEFVWKKLMQSHGCRHLPLVDNERLSKLIYEANPSRSEKKNPVVLMLGGLGTRLRPLTKSIPKPLLQVGDRPLLESVLERFVDQGFLDFYFCINYLGEKIERHFGDGSDFGVNIRYIKEEKSLGTAGALSLIDEQFTSNVIVMNGDVLTKIDFSSLLNFHNEIDADVTVCVREYTQQVPYGVVDMSDHRVSQLIEKPVYRYFVNAGIYVLDPRMITILGYNEFREMPGFITDMVNSGSNVSAFPITEYWKDIGQMLDYEQAQYDYEVHFTKVT